MIARSSFKSRKLAKCSDSEHLLFYGLIIEADDDGIGEGDTFTLSGAFFNRRWSEDEIAEMMENLAKNALVYWYTNNGGQYYQVVDFDKWQTFHGIKKVPSTLPKPGSPESEHHEGCSGTPAGVESSTSHGDKLSEVKGSKRYMADYSAAFLAAKEEYPQRKGDQNYPGAWKGWGKYLGQEVEGRVLTEDDLIRCCKNYCVSASAAGHLKTEYVMQMATFFGKDARFLEYMENNIPKSCGNCEDGGPEFTYCLKAGGTVHPDNEPCAEYRRKT
jgi:hypothetical protein